MGALDFNLTLKKTQRSSWQENLLLIPVTFFISTFIHLLLDGVPHYNWVAEGSLFGGVRYEWYLREALVLLPVSAFLLYVGRDQLQIILAGMIGGLYPDFEKLLYLNFDLPAFLVLFDWHSLAVSTPHETVSRLTVGLLDLTVLISSVAGIIGLAWLRRTNKREKC